MMSTDTSLISCIVDTDIAIDYLRGREYARELLSQWNDRGLLAASVITHLEIYQGMRPQEEERTNAFLNSMTAIEVGISVARLAGTLMGDQRRQGVTISTADAIIGATALANQVPLLTNNVRHYPFPDLTLVKGILDT